MSVDSRASVERFTLYVEPRSRYDNHRAMPAPNETPNDGLGRVIVDSRHVPPLSQELLPFQGNPRTRTEGAAYLQNAALLSAYSGMVGLVSGRLVGPDGFLWCVGEKRPFWTDAFIEATGLDIACLQVDSVSSLFAFRRDARDVTSSTLWPFFSSDYGARIFAFDASGTELEKSLVQLEAVLRRDAPAVAKGWEAVERERKAEKRNAEPGAALAYMADDGRPEAANEAVRLWRSLYKSCLERDGLTRLCSDARLCVLPDIKHKGTVSFNSVSLSAERITDTIQAVLHENALECSQSRNDGDEWRYLSDFYNTPLYP